MLEIDGFDGDCGVINSSGFAQILPDFMPENCPSPLNFSNTCSHFLPTMDYLEKKIRSIDRSINQSINQSIEQ